MATMLQRQAPRHEVGLTRPEGLIDRMFDAFWRNENLPAFFGETGWLPAVDVSETAQAIMVKAELPGLKSENIEVAITGDLLTLTGEKSEEKTEKHGESRYSERRFGRFARTIALPAAVDEEKVEAVFKDGVLTITVPKAEVAQKRKIAVKTA